jgi:hypothetical protein
VHPLQFPVAIIERIRQMRRRAAGLAAADRPIVQYDHALARPRQQIRRHHPGNARSHHTGISAGFTLQPRTRQLPYRGMP